MSRFTAGKPCLLAVAVAAVACSGAPPPVDPADFACNGTPPDLIIQHREAASGLLRTNREVNFAPGVPEVVVGTTGVGELCVAFDRANGGWKTAELANFQTVWGPPVTVTVPEDELSLNPRNPSALLRIESSGPGHSLVKYDLRLYRADSAEGTPALTLDPVFIIKNHS